MYLQYKTLKQIFKAVFQTENSASLFKLFSNVFYFFTCSMKNPFLNTDNYTIVRQFKRLNSKKRSNSSSNYSSSSSSYSPSIKYTEFSSFSTKQNKRKLNRGQKQYLICKKQRQVRIQNLRSQAFGIEEFRYRPQYFKEIQHKSNKYFQFENQTNQKTTDQKDNQIVKYKKLVYYCQKQNEYIPIKKVQTQQEMKINFNNQQQNRLKQINDEEEYQYINLIKNRKKNKKNIRNIEPQKYVCQSKTNSKIESMVSIKANKNVQIRSDCYSSSTKLQQVNSPKQKMPVISRSIKKKCSLFERLRRSQQSDEEIQNECYKINLERVGNEINDGAESTNQIDGIVQYQKSLKSSNFLTTGTKVSTNYDDSKDPCEMANPPVIYVRDKIYYINQAHKRRLRSQFQ